MLILGDIKAVGHLLKFYNEKQRKLYAILFESIKLNVQQQKFAGLHILTSNLIKQYRSFM